MRRISVVALLAAAAAVSTTTPAQAAKPVWAQAGAAFRPCATEDSDGPCYWDAKVRGNGAGRSFWVDAQQRVHYPTARVHSIAGPPRW